MTRLYERMRVPCVRMLRRSVADGEGGWAETWAEGRSFAATIVRDTSAEARVAEAAGVANAYTVTCSEELSFGDVFKRVSDGRPPACATFTFTQCTAEEWRLPDAD